MDLEAQRPMRLGQLAAMQAAGGYLSDLAYSALHHPVPAASVIQMGLNYLKRPPPALEEPPHKKLAMDFKGDVYRKVAVIKRAGWGRAGVRRKYFRRRRSYRRKYFRKFKRYSKKRLYRKIRGKSAYSKRRGFRRTGVYRLGKRTKWGGWGRGRWQKRPHW